MPVLPEVGSMMTVPALILPSRSPASIMARPMRSFTLASGLKNSAFTKMLAGTPLAMRLSLMSGVLPMVATTSGKVSEDIRIIKYW